MKKAVGIVNRLIDMTPREILHEIARKVRSGRRAGYADVNPVVFVLSTGRVGTRTLADLGGLARSLCSVHEPSPGLYALSKAAYDCNDRVCDNVIAEAFLLARKRTLQACASTGQGYLETSPQLTFLAYGILNLLPKALFIHIVRHPAEVVRSGMRRGWYAGHGWDKTRIAPNPVDVHSASWQSYSPFQKNLWLWAETNSWISRFSQTLPAGQFLELRSEDLFAGNEKRLTELFTFLREDLPSRQKLSRVLSRQRNAQLAGSFPSYEDWDSEKQKALQALCGDVAARYGYEL